MEVKVRVDAKYIVEIDRKAAELSKKLGRNYSRNEYFKMLIQRDDLEDIKQDKFDRALENMIAFNKRFIDTLQEYIYTHDKLTIAVAKLADVDLSELLNALDADLDLSEGGGKLDD